MELSKEQLEQLQAMTSETVKLALEESKVTQVNADPPLPIVEPTKAGKAVSPWDSFSGFAHDVWASGIKGKSVAIKEWAQKTAGELEEGDLSQGGFLVPEEFRAQLLNVALEASVVRPRALRIPMSTNRVVMPAAIDDDHATDFFGGIVIQRTAEAAQKTTDSPVFGQVALTLHKLTGLVRVSDELLEDSPISLEPIIGTMFGEAIAFVEDEDFISGDGSNKALGAFNASNPSLISQAIEGGQAPDTIITENILKMWSRVHPRSMRNAVWLANNDTFPQLATMSLSVGTGGIPVYMPANSLAGAPFGTLMGRPLILTEKMETIGDAGDIGIADFSQYFIGDKGGIKTAASIHLRFDFDQTVFRFVLRYDGRPSWLTTLTPRNSTTTLSPFVRLAERA